VNARQNVKLIQNMKKRVGVVSRLNIIFVTSGMLATFLLSLLGRRNLELRSMKRKLHALHNNRLEWLTKENERTCLRWSTSRSCDTRDAANQAAHFVRFEISHGGCPHSFFEFAAVARFLKHLHVERRKSDPLSKVRILDIGANKGYFAAHHFGSLCPFTGLHPKSLFSALDKSTIHQACGVCSDCKEIPEILPLTQLNDCPLRIQSFDGNSALVEYMRELIFTKFRGVQEFWMYDLKAFAGTSGTTSFPSDRSASELNSITSTSSGQHEHKNAVDVTVGTLDEDTRELQPDVIKIDTEGYDPGVLEGGKNSFCSEHRNHTVSVIMFEKNTRKLWSETDTRLKDIVSLLDSCEYNCYVVGPNKELAKLSQGCWHEAWEALTWSNIMCAHRTVARSLVNELDGWVIMDKPL
jgi:FkbM family methyltransferase